MCFQGEWYIRNRPISRQVGLFYSLNLRWMHNMYPNVNKEECLTFSLIASCYRFSCYYLFSDIAINSVNPPFIWRLEFSKNGYLNISLYIRLFLKPFLYFNILSIIWQLLLSVKWRHLFSCEVKTRPIYGMETNI